MADAVVLKTKKLFANKLLSRRQMLLEVHHGNKPTPTRKEIRDKVLESPMKEGLESGYDILEGILSNVQVTA